jgi:hypothetical protein
MLKDIISAQAIHPHQIHLRFEDGIEGTIDLTEIIEFSGIFAPSKTPPTSPSSKSTQKSAPSPGATAQTSTPTYSTRSSPNNPYQTIQPERPIYPTSLKT